MFESRVRTRSKARLLGRLIWFTRPERKAAARASWRFGSLTRLCRRALGVCRHPLRWLCPLAGRPRST